MNVDHSGFQFPSQSPFREFRLVTNGLYDTGWRRCIGCLKLLVSFCKRAINYRALWRKTPCKDKAWYASSPSCIYLELYETYLCVCMCIHIYTNIYMYVFIHVCTYIHGYVCVCVYVFIHMCICMYSRWERLFSSS